MVQVKSFFVAQLKYVISHILCLWNAPMHARQFGVSRPMATDRGEIPLGQL